MEYGPKGRCYMHFESQNIQILQVVVTLLRKLNDVFCRQHRGFFSPWYYGYAAPTDLRERVAIVREHLCSVQASLRFSTKHTIRMEHTKKTFGGLPARSILGSPQFRDLLTKEAMFSALTTSIVWTEVSVKCDYTYLQFAFNCKSKNSWTPNHEISKSFRECMRNESTNCNDIQKATITSERIKYF